MPILLPERRQVRAIEKAATGDKLAVSAIAIGFCAIVGAAIVYDSGGSKFSASYILLAAAALAAVILCWRERPSVRD